MSPSPLNIALKPSAQLDLEEVWLFTANNWSPAQADTYIDAIERRLNSLAQMPEMSPLRTEFTPPVRINFIGQHVLIYTVTDDALEVLRILSNRQNWLNIINTANEPYGN